MPTATRMRSQQGLAAAAVILVITLGAIALLLGRGFFRPGADLGRLEVTTERMTRISNALVEYAKLQGRLPCPARGDQQTGEENRTAASADCTKDAVAANDGVVPWKTLGLRRDDAIDGWARKISYRVYSGATGFTQDSGLNMTNCNASLGAPISASLGSGSLCQSAASPNPPPNTPAQFWAARTDMPAVQDLGVAKTNLAFVLISHGETGYGAYLADGAASRTSIPGGRAAEETTNVGSAGSYHILAASGTFDDMLTYMSATDLIDNAKIASRPWLDRPLSATFSGSAVAAAAPGFDPGTSQDTGLATISMGGFAITAYSGAATTRVGFREQSGVGGIGAIGGGSTSGDLNSSLDEKLTFQLGTGSEFGKMDVALNAFQIANNDPLREERAEISFWKGGAVVQTTTIDAWNDRNDPAKCSFRLASGQSFDRMDVAAVDQTGGGGSSRFTVAGVKACSDSDTSCDSLSGANRCPIPPPSALSGTATGIGKTTATLQGIVENNGVAIGTGTGYRTSTDDSIGFNLIDLVSGSGTILAGNCLKFQGDGNTYVVETGIAAPGTIRIADPGLFQAISASSPRNVTLEPCITSTRFDFGTTLGYGSTVAASPATINAGSGSTCITATVTGLACGTTYYYRARAASLANTAILTSITTGGNSSFSTAACAAVEPSASSLAATNIGTSTARLNGTVNDNGLLTTVTFEYGLTPCYGSSVAAVPATLNAGTGSTAVVADLTGLTCNTYYYYRVVAANSTATTAGNATLFQTAACS